LPVKYYPEDQNEQGYIGIRFPTNGNGSSNGGFFNMSRSTEEQAVTNYINLLLTKPGERFYHPTYGIFIQQFLFQPITDGLLTEIEFIIRQQSAIWLPYIVNHAINIHANSDSVEGTDSENSIQINITFSATERGANKNITLFQNQGRVSYIVE